jgi:arylsulfatase A-like enzyme
MGEVLEKPDMRQGRIALKKAFCIICLQINQPCFKWVALGLLSLMFFADALAQSSKDGNRQKKQEVADRPNVLFIAIDDLNDWTGFLGGNPQAKTPNLDKLAKSGIAFTHAYASAPSCGPSRTALLYGLYPHRTGAYGNSVFYSPRNIRTLSQADGIPDMFRTQKSLPTTFRENGYFTAGAGKIDHFTTRENNPEIEGHFNVYFSPKDKVEPDPTNPESFQDVFGPGTPESTEEMVDTKVSDWGIKQLKVNHEQTLLSSSWI